MDEKTAPTPVNEDPQPAAPAAPPAVEAETHTSTPAANASAPTKPRSKKAVTAKGLKTPKKQKRHSKKYLSSTDDDSSSLSGSIESDETTSSSDSETARKKRKAKAKKTKVTKVRKAKAKAGDSSSGSSDDSSSSDDENNKKATKAKKAKKLKKLKAQMKALKAEDDSDSDSDSDSSDDEGPRRSRPKKKRKSKKGRKDATQDSPGLDTSYDPTQNPNQRRGLRRNTGTDITSRPSPKQVKRDAKATKKAEARRKKLKGTKLEFVRVDRLWDYDQHAYITRETRADSESGEYDEYVFNVRRIFNWDNKHISTVVDIKSKPLKESLIKVMGIVKGISLAEDTPSIDPNMIFLYLEELRAYMSELKVKAKAEKKKKIAKEITIKRKAMKVLIKYLDKDYDETKKTLYPMLESGTITFDLLWALFKSNEIVYAPTYSTEEVPRAFKIEYANLVGAKDRKI